MKTCTCRAHRGEHGSCDREIVAVHDPGSDARWNNCLMGRPMVRRVGAAVAVFAAALSFVLGAVTWLVLALARMAAGGTVAAAG